jgi:hypothetical protein
MRKLLLLPLLMLYILARAEDIRWAWTGAAAAGAAIDSGVQNISGAASVTCISDNSAGGSGRNFIATWYLDDGTTSLFVSTTAVALGTTGVVVIDPSATTATGITPVPMTPARKMRFQLAAGGAAAGRLTCWGR